MHYSRLCMWAHILLGISLNEALPIYSPTLLPFPLAPPSFFLFHLLQALALTVATMIQRLWNYLHQKHNNNQ